MNRDWIIRNTTDLAGKSIFRYLFGSLLAAGTSENLPTAELEPESFSFQQRAIEMVANPMQMIKYNMKVEKSIGTESSWKERRTLKGRNPIEMVDNPMIANDASYSTGDLCEKWRKYDLTIKQPRMVVEL